MKTVKSLKTVSKRSRFRQGDFSEHNPKKYFGQTPIVYRSSWELTLMRNLEYNPNVHKWTSEPIAIPYISREKDGTKWIEKRRKYFPDFLVVMKSGKVLLIEVKPLNQVPLNEAQVKFDPTMMKNYCKWKAVSAFCKQKGWEFRIMTEKELKKPIS